MSICLLNRLVKETEWFLSDWQAGFRKERGCRDNVLLLRVIYDNIIRNKTNCVVTYIDFAAAFDSVSHKYIDAALGKAGASRKTRAIFRAIYKAAQGAARVQGLDGEKVYSHTFNICRGVIQGDIISPIFFVLALDQLIQQRDNGQGISVGSIKALGVLGYADDLAMMEYTIEDMTARLTNFADAACADADMNVKMKKTYTQLVCEQEPVEAPTAAELTAKELTYKHACEFAKAGCGERFKTKQGMKIHSAGCKFNYGTTEETFDVKSIREVFGKKARRLYLVEWRDYPGSDSWEPEHMLLEDGCKPTIDEFWLRSKRNPASAFYPEPEDRPRCWVCGWTSNKSNKPRVLKCHLTRKKHWWSSSRARLTAKKDVRRDKLEEKQKALPKIKWGKKPVKNC